jgi:EmrB/QacA subfamily drug resistance transporter
MPMRSVLGRSSREVDQLAGELPRARTRVVFAALMLVILLAALDATILASALPTIVDELNGLAAIAWVTTEFMLAQIAVAPVYGKLGDIYGRKTVLQVAVVVFMVGSALCGMSRTMLELVASRAVQGAGAGGLMVLVQAIVGDIVAPRGRAKYQTLFGSVFGVASVGGPLLGGYLVEQLSWRWIFFVNLPLGILAVAVLAVVLPASRRRSTESIDYKGAALLAAGLTSLSLLVTLSGHDWSWLSVPGLALALCAAAFLGAFVIVERRAPDPILPAAIGRNPVFRVAAALSALLGCVMFSVVTFTPLYFQVVQGDSPTTSGLRLAAMMLGIIVAGFAAGQAISRTGRYRRFPIAGFATMAVGLLALSSIGPATSALYVELALAVFGAGLGMTMQILVTAVQNAVPHEVLGSATSAVTVVRGMGNALGPAILGAVFAAQLAAAAPGSAVEEAYVGALRPVYLVGAGLAIVGVLLALRLEDRPLRATVKTGHAALADAERALRVALTPYERRAFRTRLADRAQLSLSAETTWALVRINHYGLERARDIATREGVPAEAMDTVETELRARGLMREHALTSQGHTFAAKAANARKQLLRETMTSATPPAPPIFTLLSQLAANLPAESGRARL